MTAVSQPRITIRGALIAHRVFTADGWGKGELDADGGPVTVIGKLLNVRVGDTVECIGQYKTHPKYGDQFEVTSCTPVMSDTVSGVVLWMASRLPDVGETRARALVDYFGTTLWDVIEHNPDALTVVQGITTARAQSIHEAYALVAGEREHMTLLRGWGLTDGQVAKCLGSWGTLAVVVERIRADPFELANVVDGFGFKRADRVARAMGIAPNAPGRIRAGILHVLSVGAQDHGHCYLPGGALRDMSVSLLSVPADDVKREIFAVCEMQRVVRRGWRVYLARLDRAEAACASAIARMLQVRAA